MAEVKERLGSMKSAGVVGSSRGTLEEEELTLVEPIGKGGFGTVYKGKWRNLEVAVKMVVFAQLGPGGTTRPVSCLLSCPESTNSLSQVFKMTNEPSWRLLCVALLFIPT